MATSKKSASIKPAFIYSAKDLIDSGKTHEDTLKERYNFFFKEDEFKAYLERLGFEHAGTFEVPGAANKTDHVHFRKDGLIAAWYIE